jgi:hypothetical protein
LVHFTVFCYILWTFGIVRGNLVYFSTFWYLVQRKIWQPWNRCNLLHFMYICSLRQDCLVTPRYILSIYI